MKSLWGPLGREEGPRLCAEHQPQQRGKRETRRNTPNAPHRHALRLVLRTQSRANSGATWGVIRASSVEPDQFRPLGRTVEGGTDLTARLKGLKLSA